MKETIWNEENDEWKKTNEMKETIWNGTNDMKWKKWMRWKHEWNERKRCQSKTSYSAVGSFI